MKIPFKYYLHDDHGHGEMLDAIELRTGYVFTPDQMDKIGRPFYEVTLECLLDTETMEVTVIGAKL